MPSAIYVTISLSVEYDISYILYLSPIIFYTSVTFAIVVAIFSSAQQFYCTQCIFVNGRSIEI